MQVLAKVGMLLFVLVNHIVSADEDLLIKVSHPSGPKLQTTIVKLSDTLIEKINCLSSTQQRQYYSIEYFSLLKELQNKNISTERIRILSMQRGKTVYSTWELVKSIAIISPFPGPINIQREGNPDPGNILNVKVKVIKETDKPYYFAQVPVTGDYAWEETKISESEERKYEVVDRIQFGAHDPALYIVFA